MHDIATCERSPAERPMPVRGTHVRAQSSGGQATGKHSRKRTDSTPHSDAGATTKRQATADVAAPADPIPGSFRMDPKGTHAPPIASATASAAHNTRSRSQQRADLLFDPGEQTEHHHAPSIHAMPRVCPESEHTAPRRSRAASGAMHDIHADPFMNLPGRGAHASDHSTGMRGDVPGGRQLPVSQAAWFDDSLQTALVRRRLGPEGAIHVSGSGNPLFDPHSQNESAHEPFLPDSWDADSLAEWFVYLISWQHSTHSMQGLVGGLYMLAFTQEVWQRVTWTPMSVVALLALFAVGHSALPAGMPALSRLLRKAGVTDQARSSWQRCCNKWQIQSCVLPIDDVFREILLFHM